MVQLYEILIRSSGVLGARFSGAGFRGCCLAFVDANCAEEVAKHVKEEYSKAQPILGRQLESETAVLICEVCHGARVLTSFRLVLVNLQCSVAPFDPFISIFFFLR